MKKIKKFLFGWLVDWLEDQSEKSLKLATVQDHISWRFSGRGLHFEAWLHEDNARTHRRNARWFNRAAAALSVKGGA